MISFDDFRLDTANRQLRRGDAVVELSSRYFDALVLMVAEPGQLVTKDRFMEAVWSGIPVTDEALTQCIRTLRRQLGDDAARPRFIETVPKHGYRFIAAVEPAAVEASPPAPEPAPAPVSAMPDWLRTLLLGGAGTLGAGVAGVIGGLIYGFAGAAQPTAPGAGALSILLVLLCLTVAVALLGGVAVGFGIAIAGRRWSPLGGALGGLFVGGFARLIGLDAFNLLVGRSPGDNITGPVEGLLLGGAVGLGLWLGSFGRPRLALRRSTIAAAVTGGAAGLVIALTGRRLMGGSLDQLADAFPASRLRLDQIGALFGEAGFGPIAGAVTAALEGGLFAACIVAAMVIAGRHLDAAR